MPYEFSRRAKQKCHISFFHPDYTVGTGIAPVQLSLVDFTTGEELRLALNNAILQQNELRSKH